MSRYFKPKLQVNLNSPDGNIFAVLAKTQILIKKLNFTDTSEKIVEMRKRVTSAQSYDEALKIIGEYVELEVEE